MRFHTSQGSQREPLRLVRITCKAPSSIPHACASFNLVGAPLPPLSKFCYKLIALRGGRLPCRVKSELLDHINAEFFPGPHANFHCSAKQHKIGAKSAAVGSNSNIKRRWPPFAQNYKLRNGVHLPHLIRYNPTRQETNTKRHLNRRSAIFPWGPEAPKQFL